MLRWSPSKMTACGLFRKIDSGSSDRGESAGLNLTPARPYVPRTRDTFQMAYKSAAKTRATIQ